MSEWNTQDGLRRSLARWSAALAISLTGCAYFMPPPQPPAPAPAASAASADPDAAIFQRAQIDRADYLELEVKRLREDLTQAEEAMIAIESGLRGTQSRAIAVSTLADARIAVERASRNVPWKPGAVEEARSKLSEAEVQLGANHSGAAVFFASRAQRIANTLNAEALRIGEADNARFIRGRRVNLRAGPSVDHPVLDVLSLKTPVFAERPEGAWFLVRTLAGQVGWIHGELLR